MIELFEEYLQLSLTLLLIILFILSTWISRKVIRRHARKHNFDRARVVYITKFFNFIFFIIYGAFLAITWDISFQGVSIYMASIFTVTGVAIFASWSILSNVTASVILFFYYTYKIGSEVKIVDGDNSITGKIIDITLFYIRLEIQDGTIVSYPNNLAIQKPIIQLKLPNHNNK